MNTDKTNDGSDARVIRVFISSTFRDMLEERDDLMTHTWPQLRSLCQERHVELVEVDLRWGITESQSNRKETLKFCLDEIRACRPFFVGLLGERYGWTPGEDSFTADLQEEQPWLAGVRGKSVTELEILHGVLNNPDMAKRAFFYFRAPSYAQGRGPDYLSESAENADKQHALKEQIRKICKAKQIPLREDYPDPSQLAAMVLDDLRAVIEAQFPKEKIPDALTREAQDHEAFAEIRRRTYIGRADYFEILDRHAAGDGGPLVLLGDSGSGKSALLANWLAHWREDHPNDFIIQHYIGGTTDSADHWSLMTRLMAEIKRWSSDPEDLPTKHDAILKVFPLWLTKARARAAHTGVRCILVLDALNQLDESEHARLLGWLPEHPFSGPLRLVVSTLPGTVGSDDPLQAIRERGWQELRVQPLTVEERRRMIVDYLDRFGKKFDEDRLVRLASAEPASNPLFLKILLDDLRVTGTYERLDQRLTDYLAAADIPALLQQVLARYQRDYERDRPGLVGEALGMIYAARRGLSETELLQLLRPADLAQLPPALWTPLRAALESLLVDRGGILNFAHDFLRTAVGNAFAADADHRAALRGQLANYFEAQPITARSCDELPWLLKEIDSLARLHTCLLQVDRFLLIYERDEDELRHYWVEQLRQQQTMGKAYLESFERWSREPDRQELRIAFAASWIASFLRAAALYTEAELLMQRALEIDEHSFGKDHPDVARNLNNLALLLKDTNRLAEAEPLMRRALEINEHSLGKDHPNIAKALSNLALLFQATNRLGEAEPLMRRALEINESRFGKDHPNVAIALNNLASLLWDTNRLAEAEPLIRRALEIDERSFGKDHSNVARDLNNLANLLWDTNRLAEAEPLLRRALEIGEYSFGKDHPNVATYLNNLALLLMDTNRLAEAEPLMRRALEIDERSFGKDHPNVAIRLNNLANLLQAMYRLAEAEPLLRRALEINEHSLGKDHPAVAKNLNSLAQLLQNTNRQAEAELLMRRALEINERSLGKDHPDVAIILHNLASFLRATNRFAEAEPIMRRAVEILLKFTRTTGHSHPHLQPVVDSYGELLKAMGRSPEELRKLAPELFNGQ
jgi:tetratricopeptide (TPR) repeat protein